jgi:hypothetical protein
MGEFATGGSLRHGAETKGREKSLDHTHVDRAHGAL